MNQASIELLSRDEPDEALSILQSTQAMLEKMDQENSKIISLVSLTLNNMSCAFKR